jgi:protein TonB
MSHQVMVLEQERTSQLAKGWSLSIALHGCLILTIMVAMPKLTLTLDKEPFRWDVALVDTPSPAPAVPATAQPAQEPAPAKQAPPKQQPVRSPQPAPQIITKEVHPQESVQPITREVEPFQRETQPVQRKVETVQRDVQPVQREPQPIVEAERPRQQTEPAREVVAMQKIERQEVAKPDTVIDQPVAAEAVREIAPAVEQQVTQAAPVPLETHQVPAPVTDQVMPETRSEPEVMARAPVIESPPAVPVEKPAPAERPAEIHASEPAPVASPPAVPDAIESRPLQPVPSANDSPAPAVQEQAPVVARSIAPTQPKKADYGWLAESLHRRIVELRHYPSTARLNGWEGKVVLRVQIRQDGNLESVSVVKSSGHETLDNAAMEAVRRACPLHLKHELTSPMVVVQVPINYSLNR